MAPGGGPVPVFLHLTHFILAVITIVCLHWSGYLYDLEVTGAVQDLTNKKNKDNSLKGSDKYPDPDMYCTGMIWGVIAGLLGLAALAVLVLSFVIRLPKVIQWYYLAAAILILLFASLGLGLNPGVAAYEECLNPTTPNPKKRGQLDRILGHAPDPLFGLPEGRKGSSESKDAPKAKTPKPASAKDCVILYSAKAAMSGSYIIFIFVLSVAHSLAYVAAFLLTFFGDSSSSGVSNDQAARDQAARDQEMRDQQAQQMSGGPESATNSAAPDVEAGKA